MKFAVKSFVWIIILSFLYCNFIFGQNNSYQSAIEQSNAKVQEILHEPSISESLGSLAPIAISPFLGLALTSGATILAKNGIIENNFLATNQFLGNWWFLGIFLILTMISVIPRMTKTSKPIGMTASFIEDKAGIISVACLQLTPLLISGSFGDQNAMSNLVNEAGILSFNSTIVLSVVASINFFVIRVVRVFCDFLIFVSPIPIVDSIFEMAKIAICSLLLLIYSFSPIAAFLANSLIFILCYFIFRRAYRRVIHYENLFVKPVLNKLINRQPCLISKKLSKNLKSRYSNIDFAIPVFPMQKVGKVKRKMYCFLISENETLWLVKPKWLNKSIFINLNDHFKGNFKIGKDILWMQIYNDSTENSQSIVLDVSFEYSIHYEMLIKLGSLNDIKDIGYKAKGKAFLEGIKTLSNSKVKALIR